MSNFLSQGIPVGDKLRTSGAVSVTTGVETTLLTVASGGGLIHGIHFDYVARQLVNNIKVTVDGAAERTLTYGIYSNYEVSGVGYSNSVFFPEPLRLPPCLDIATPLTSHCQRNTFKSF